MQIGLVGAPNSGKSTFFKAATLADVEIADYPFTTIKPNVGVGFVTAPCPCKELGKPCNPKNSQCSNGTRLIPVKLLDVAGLVPGAHEGKGLGNQFLNDLIPASALIHILDVSGRTNEKGEKTQGYNPMDTIKFLEEELDLWFTDIFKREWYKFSKTIEMKHLDFEKQILDRFSGLGIDKDQLRRAIEKADVDPTKPAQWKQDDVLRFTQSLRREIKPIVTAANKMDLTDSEENLKRIKGNFSDTIISCCAEVELALREASSHNLIKYTPGQKDFKILNQDKVSPEQKKGLEFIKKFLEKHGDTGIQLCLNKTVFEVLDQIVAYPVEDETHWTDKKGNILPDAFLLRKGSTTKDLAYKVHTDIGDKFIGAIDARTKRKIGADYELKDGDIIKILTSK